MRINEAIEQLQSIWDAHGNLEVVVYESNDVGDCAAYTAEISEHDGVAAIHLIDAQILPCGEI